MSPRLAVILAALAGSTAVAKEDTPAPPRGAPPAAHLAPASDDSPRSTVLTAYLRGGVNLYLSDAQTAGGVGGGVGMRMTFDERFFGQLDVSQLLLVGNATLLRAGVGVQRRGTWAPAATLSASVYPSDRLRFATGARDRLVTAPAVALGVNLSPIRFVGETSEITLFELGAGLGLDFPGRGNAINIGLLEVGFRL